MTQQAVDNRMEIASIKAFYDSGAIDRETAKELAQPILDRINEEVAAKTKELNAKYGMKRRPACLDFINAMRNSY